MAHQFSEEIHHYLSSRIEKARDGIARAQARGDELAVRSEEGALEELVYFRNTIAERYDLKRLTHL